MIPILIPVASSPSGGTKFSGDVLEELTGVRYPHDLCFLPVLPAPASSASSKLFPQPQAQQPCHISEGTKWLWCSLSFSWFQQLGRDFQVLAVSVLLLPWLQTSSVTLLCSSWIPAGCSSFLQPLTESCPSRTKAAGAGFHHFCLKLHLGLSLCYSDFCTLLYLVLSDPFKSPF